MKDMLMLANVAVLLLLSILPGGSSRSDAHGVRALVHDDRLRGMLLEGRFDDYDSALGRELSRNLAGDLAARGGRGKTFAAGQVEKAVGGGDLAFLFEGIKKAIAVATFAAQLQTLGPVQAMRMAVGWVESGLIRRSGIKPDDFGSFFEIASNPSRKRITGAEEQALAGDLHEATRAADAGYSKLLVRLTESFF
jgi:hypothetical protein